MLRLRRTIAVWVPDGSKGPPVSRCPLGTCRRSLPGHERRPLCTLPPIATTEEPAGSLTLPMIRRILFFALRAVRTSRGAPTMRLERKEARGADATRGEDQPAKLSRTPAATAEPMTPATLGPMACISRKLWGLASSPTLLATRAAMGTADTPAAPMMGLTG